MPALRALGVFCGSSAGDGEAYTTVAHRVGHLLAARGIELVFGGGGVGLMGTVADACLAGGGTVTGVIPIGLFTKEIAHRGATHLHEVGSMHERKKLMYDLSDAFLALPGGFGTLEELAEATTWTQLGLHGKPLALLDVNGFWDPLVAQLDRMVADGFLKPENRRIVELCASPEQALEHLAGFEPVPVEKWISPEER